MAETHESASRRIERLELEGLGVGDIVRITTGVGEEAYQYRFAVEEAGRWPLGQFEETRPDGTSVGPFPMLIHGSGRWTTRQQNPVQSQEHAFTSYFDSLSPGGFLLAAAPDAPFG